MNAERRREEPADETTAVWYIWDDATGSLRGHLVALQSEWRGDRGRPARRAREELGPHPVSAGGLMRLIRLENKNDECWAHLPAVRRSIEEAGVAFGQKPKGVAGIIDRVVASFITLGHPDIPTAQQDTAAAWYALDDEGRVCGHLIVLLDQWDGEACAYVYQLWAKGMASRTRGLGRDVSAEQLQNMAADEMEAYARGHGCTSLLMYTKRPSRFWGRRFDFTLHRFLYQRRLS